MVAIILVVAVVIVMNVEAGVAGHAVFLQQRALASSTVDYSVSANVLS